MSTVTPVPTVPKVRTYAADLTAMRALRGIAPKVTTSTVTKVAAVPLPKKSPLLVAKPAPTKSKINTSTPVAKKAVVPPAPAEKTAAAQKQIPPFHTLQKPAAKTAGTVQTINTEEFTATQKTANTSVLANPGVEQLAVNSKEESTATVITDTKRKQLSITGAIITSISDWWNQKKKVAVERKKPKYTIPEADRRKGVIQKATTQTGRTSTSDHEAALARIKAAKKTTRHTPPPRMVPAAQAVPTAGWTTDDVATPEASVTPVVTVTPITVPKVVPQVPPTPTVAPRSTSTDEAPAPIPKIVPIIPSVLPKTESEAVAEVTVPKIIPIIPAVPVAQTDTIAEKLEALERAAEDKRNQPVEKISDTSGSGPVPMTRPRITPTIPEPPQTEVAPASVTLTNTLEDEDASPATSLLADSISEVKTVPRWSQSIAVPKNTTSISLTSLLAWSKTQMRRTNHLALSIASVCGVVAILWFSVQALLTSRTTAPVVTDTTLTSFESGTVIIPTSPITNKAELTAALHAESGTESLTELSLINADTTLPYTATELFALLGASVDVNFAGSISGTTIGQYHEAPWILLQSNDIPTAQGGMLAWENQMSSDLSPWFGEVVTTGAKSGITLFHDGVIAGHDVRILTDKDSTERIIYGFISGNQLLITTNTTAFLNLAEKSVRK